MFNEIITAINTQIQAIPNVPVLATENSAYKPTLLTKWMRSTLLPSEPSQVTIGANRTLRYIGIIQLDYFIPANTASTDPMIDTIVAYFNNQNNRFLTQGGQPITILMAWRGTSTTATDWYRTPIMIRYQAYDNL